MLSACRAHPACLVMTEGAWRCTCAGTPHLLHHHRATQCTHTVSAACSYESQTGIANKSTYWVVFELIWRDFFR